MWQVKDEGGYERMTKRTALVGGSSSWGEQKALWGNAPMCLKREVIVLIGLNNNRPFFQELVDGLTWSAKASARTINVGCIVG